MGSPSQAAGVASRQTHEAGPCPVVIVVLNRDGRRLLPGCLTSIAALDRAPLAVYLVDNASSDGSCEFVSAEYPTVRIIGAETNRGVASGRNLAIEPALAEAGAEWLLFIDNDTLLDAAAVERLVAAGEIDERIGLVAAKAYRRPDQPVLASAGGMRFDPWRGAAWDVASGEIDDGGFDAPREIQACPGFAFFVRRSVIETIGAFDEAFNPYGWEDVDYSLRAAKAGFRLRPAPDAVVHHAGGRAGRGPNVTYERHKVAKMFHLVRRHATPVQYAVFLAILPVRTLLRATKELVSGNPGVVLAWAQGLLGALPKPWRSAP